MIAAVSARIPSVSRAANSASKARTGWAFQPLPNLNRETRQAIGKAKAGWTFSVICTELGYAVHKGRATWDKQRLGIGLRAVARESGQDVRKVRRDVRALEALGLLVIHVPNVLHVSDPATGRIVTKAKGRCQEAQVYLTITESVLRPAKVHRGARDGSTMEPPVAIPKGHHGATVREEKDIQRTPVGPAVGVGRPQAAQEAGLPAGKTGGHPAAKAGQEEPPVVPVDAGRDEPALPTGRLVPTAARTPVWPTGRPGGGERGTVRIYRAAPPNCPNDLAVEYFNKSMTQEEYEQNLRTALRIHRERQQSAVEVAA